MKRATQFLSVLLAMCMVMAVLPIQAAATDDEGNNQTVHAEEWVYIPDTQTNLATSAGVSYVSTFGEPLAASTGGASDTVRVHVAATDKATGNKVDVEGAVVNLYVGDKYISTAGPTDSEGNTTVSMAGLTKEQRRNATVSASKVIAQGKAIDGTARDKLFNYFPKDDSGDYYRYTLELHSETIDENGNWMGTEIPVGKESGKADIVFAIDATGSMGDEINNVKNNIANFSKSLDDRGLDIRFAVIEYRDITEGEETIIHKVSGSQWFDNSDDVVETLKAISVDGGGDGPETPIDALGYITDNSLMHWRSDADCFAFVLTDAGYKVDNDYGYTSLEDITRKLNDMHIVTSVITNSGNRSAYRGLFEGTGGIYADIYSTSFDDEMLNLADSIVETVVRDVELELHEPRMLVNLSVCYFADDKASQSESYKDSVKNMLDEYANRVAETTDGHVLLDKVILFSTDNRLDFYDTSKTASMADIRIESEEKDDGSWWFNVGIHNNSYANGFYTAQEVLVNDSYISSFNHLKDADKLLGKKTFTRIISGGIDINNYSMIDDVYEFSATQTHETGHYVFGFFDEYMDGDGRVWSVGTHVPYSNYKKSDDVGFGLMDNQYKDIEISKLDKDYAYLSSGGIRTYHFNAFEESCEDTLSDLLTTGTNTLLRNPYNFTYISLPSKGIFNEDGDYSLYKITYTKAPGSEDRTATYPYAGLGESDFIYIPISGGGSGTWSINAADTSFTTSTTTEETEAADSLAAVSWMSDGEAVSLTITPVDGYTYSVEMRESGNAFSTVELTNSDAVLTANLPLAKGGLAEVRIIAEKAGETKYNTYYVDRSEDTDVGYMYSSADNGTMAYVMANEMNSYTFVADNTKYTNGDYRSVSQATHIISDNGITIGSGEIYSVAAHLAEIDYTTLSWFKYADGVWTKLDTDYSEEENMNIGARADLDGAGMYVLMAKAAPVGGAKAAEDLHLADFDPVNDRDATATLDFTDPNTGSKFYNVYYSDEKFTDKNADGVVVRSFYAEYGTELTVNLIDRNRTVYAAVEIVLEDGSRSKLSDVILVSGEADSDGDGLPDWYCDKYLLWDKGDTSKPVAERDPDGDGLTNLEEYNGGSDPTNPNDPVHTTNIPVESISVIPDAVEIAVGTTKEITVTVLPENATNKNVQWSSEDEGIATVSETGIIIAKALGTTTVYAVTADGGYSAAVEVTIVPGETWRNPFIDVFESDWYYDEVAYAAQNGLMNGTSATTFLPNASTTRAMFVTILHRLEKSPAAGIADFDDVEAGTWYSEAVAWASANSIVNGYSYREFGPNDSITREQMAAILYRYADYKGYDVSGLADLASYTDANAISNWALTAMRWAKNEGLITGRTAATLVPNGTATRAEVAAILMRFCQNVAGIR